MEAAVESHLIGILFYRVPKKLQLYNLNTLYFHPLLFSRQKQSVAPLLFNIKERGLAHCVCVRWVNFS